MMRPSLAAALLSVTLVGMADGQEQEPRDEEKTLNQWIEKLEHKDVEVRRSAAKALQEMGPGAKEAVPVLIRALRDNDQLVRANAAWALGSVGPEAEQAIPNLIEALQDEVMIVRMGAAGGLGGIGPRAKEAIPALAKALQNPVEDHNVHRVAAEALGRMGPEAIPVLGSALQSEDYFVRRMSARALGETGARAVPALTKALEDKDDSVRWIAVEALGGIGPEARQSVPALTKALQDERYNVRTSATRALWLIRVGAREARKTGTFPHGEVKDGLAAFLFCHKNRFEVGEPIPLTYGIILVGPGLQSRDEEAYKLEAKVWRPCRAVDPDNMSWFEVTGPDGASVPYNGIYVSWATPSPTPSNTAILRHGEFVGRTHSDLCEQGAFHLSKPGQYKVQWGYAPWGEEGPWVGKLISNEVQFEIVADSAADEADSPGTFPHGDVKDGLAAFLLCHKNGFEVGEPIPLSYGIILVGPGLQSGDEEAYKLEAKVWRPWPPVDPDNGSWFEVTGPDGASVPYMGEYVSWPTPSPSPSNTAILRYGEFLGRTHSDLCEQGTFDLSKPGQYMVRWGYSPWGEEGPWVGKLISNEVQLEIVADSAADEADSPGTQERGRED